MHRIISILALLTTLVSSLYVIGEEEDFEPQTDEAYEQVQNETGSPRVHNPSDDSGIVSLSLGVQWYSSKSSNFYFPISDLQVSVSGNVCLGVLANYYSVGDLDFSYSAYELLGGLHIYSEDPYDGLWVQVLGGIFSNKTEVSIHTSHVSALSFLGTVGWRWLWEQGGTSFGVAGGIQGFFGKQSAILPTFLFVLGVPL